MRDRDRSIERPHSRARLDFIAAGGDAVTVGAGLGDDRLGFIAAGGGEVIAEGDWETLDLIAAGGGGVIAAFEGDGVGFALIAAGGGWASAPGRTNDGLGVMCSAGGAKVCCGA
jgi:hypothetical protein